MIIRIFLLKYQAISVKNTSKHTKIPSDKKVFSKSIPSDLVALKNV